MKKPVTVPDEFQDAELFKITAETMTEWMEYGGERFRAKKMTPYYRKHIAESPKGTMPVKLQQERYGAVGYGGQRHWRIQSNIWRNVIFVNE